MKTLILNGSPRPNGNTVQLITALKQHLKGEIVELSAYYDNIKPCNDCRACWKQPECIIEDDMRQIYADDYDIVVIASPVHMSMLPAPMVGVGSRFQTHYAASRFLNEKIVCKPKTAVFLLTGGGGGAPTGAIALSKLMFKEMNAKFANERFVSSLDTDNVPAGEDKAALAKIEEIARELNQAHGL